MIKLKYWSQPANILWSQFAEFLYYICVLHYCYSFTFYFLFTLEWYYPLFHSFICIIIHYSLDVEAIINEITSVAKLNHCEHDRPSRLYKACLSSTWKFHQKKTKVSLIVRDLKSARNRSLSCECIFLPNANSDLIRKFYAQSEMNYENFYRLASAWEYFISNARGNFT